MVQPTERKGNRSLVRRLVTRAGYTINAGDVTIGMADMTRQRTNIRVGISGWTYAPWRGHFFPDGLPRKCELGYAATQFPAIEINGTFYGLQKPDVFSRWARETPGGFVFAVKGSRYITHSKRLRDIETPLANFLASGVLRLGPKLGPMLWQFPPSFRFDAGLMREFLTLLPKDTGAASQLARQHDGRLDGRAETEAQEKRALRHAVEIRHDSFRDKAFVDLLAEHGVALVCADTVEWPRLMDLTADFVYCRLHGSTELYRSRYGDSALARWAERVASWADGRTMEDGTFIVGPEPHAGPRDVFVFFDNTDKLHAPDDAARLMAMLSLVWRSEVGEAA